MNKKIPWRKIFVFYGGLSSLAYILIVALAFFITKFTVKDVKTGTCHCYIKQLCVLILYLYFMKKGLFTFNYMKKIYIYK